MPSLSRDLRRQLEKTIAGENGARQIAEAGAEQSLQRLAVDRHEPHTSLTPDERALRNQLRAHGRQLGDKLDPQRGTQTIAHLKQAVAYEHWHRMLFARFLAENDLLLHPKHGVALSLDEVKELALGLKRDWIEVAAEYAQRMLLREVFRPDDPILRVPLPPEKRLELEGKLNSLPREIFLADDSLGWVYQFWQRDAKDEVNRSEVKIGADELAPVTQLFTEDYMVLFLLENTLGAWWTARRGAPDLPGYTWTYLRLNEDGSPCAGTFDGWPKNAKELKVLDPCMGSGHFLTFALPILARMRVAEEGTCLSGAITAVLRDNLFGLELDPRCSQIAAFNLALTAWKLAGQHFELPRLNLACSGLGINAKEEDWVKLAGEDGRKRDLMRWLYPLFSHAPTLGSLIDPRRAAKPTDEAELVAMLPLLERALAIDDSSDETHELAIAAQGLLAAARILADEFTLVATNVPYLGRGKQDDQLKEHCETFHGEAKADLATCFVERSLRACASGGSVALVTPQNWLFLTSYKRLRERLLTLAQWDLVARLGEHAFESPAAAGAFVSLLGLTRQAPPPEHTFGGWDVSEAQTPEGKARALESKPLRVNQAAQLKSPDARITFEESIEGRRLGSYADSYLGLGTCDAPHYVRNFWELPSLSGNWACMQVADSTATGTGGFENVVSWDAQAKRVHGMTDEERVQGHNQDYRGRLAWGRRGVAVGLIRNLRISPYFGDLFDKSVAVIVPKEDGHLASIECFCQSTEYSSEVRKLDQKLMVTNSTLVKVPFSLERWNGTDDTGRLQQTIGRYVASCSQWLFSGQPAAADHPLQAAVARLLGYRWPRQTGSGFLDCPAIESDRLEPLADSDGIVCLPSVAGEDGAAARLRSLLRAADSDEYGMGRLLEGRKSLSLENWLRDEFFEEHCRIYQDRPFIWHVWDGVTDGFHALVNCHLLDRKALEKLIYSYLGDWLTRQRQDVQNSVEGSDARLAAAEHLQGELKKIYDGEAPYDIFVRWKPLKEQPVGWEPALNDGVRMNIRPWIAAAKLYKATKPGILRITPNIKYTKDRGKEPARDPKEFPWFKGSTDRINDHHLSLDEKRRARGL
jgi:hypothetical protein